MDENLMCPICGGLHPAGHRDKELEDRLEAIENWFKENIPEWIHKKDWLSVRRVTIKADKLIELDEILEAEGR